MGIRTSITDAVLCFALFCFTVGRDPVASPGVGQTPLFGWLVLAHRYAVLEFFSCPWPKVFGARCFLKYCAAGPPHEALVFLTSFPACGLPLQLHNNLGGARAHPFVFF